MKYQWRALIHTFVPIVLCAQDYNPWVYHQVLDCRVFRSSKQWPPILPGKTQKETVCQMFTRWTAGPTRILTPIAVSCVLIFWLNRVKTLQVALEELPLKLTLLTLRSPSLLETAKLSCFSQRHCRERLSQKAWLTETDAWVWSWNSLANILCRWQVSHFFTCSGWSGWVCWVWKATGGNLLSTILLLWLCSQSLLFTSQVQRWRPDPCHANQLSEHGMLHKVLQGHTWWVTDWS